MIKREIIAEKPFKNSNTKPDPHTCGFCRDVFVEAKEKTPWSNAFKDVVVNKTVSQISHFASHHCTFFQLIWNTVTAHQRISSFEIPSEESSLAIVAAFRRPDTIHNLHDYDRMLLQVGRTDKNSLKYVGAFDLYAPSTDPASQWISSRPRNLDVAAEQSYALARSWIQNCLQDHSQHRLCAKKTEVRLPTRVLDVEDGVKLYLTNEALGTYATLSYCWGGPQPLTTMKGNLQAHFHGIDFAALPATIQDAITVTRRLGIRYLWIDSLCIIQNSPEDKEREIVEMAQIYQNSLVTISAASASSCSVGFLKPRQPFESERWSFQFAHYCPDGTVGHIIASPQGDYDPDDEPINSRAWTHQERLLSPRVLTYSSWNLLWQCHGLSASDGGVRGSYIPNMDHFSSISGQHEAQMYSDWKEIVKAYSKKKVSVLQDRLVALSAVAALFEEHWQGFYRAGLWMPYLKQGLLWSAAQQPREAKNPRAIYEPGGEVDYQTKIPSPTFFPLQRTAEYIAPSWSWASVDGPVELAGITKEADIDFEVLECNVSPVTNTVPLGALHDGTIKLRGRLNQTFCVDHGTKLADAGSNVVLLDGKVPGHFKHGAYGLVIPDETDLFSKSDVPVAIWCLVGQYRPQSSAEWANGLVLVPDGERGCFKRVGFFRLTAQNAGDTRTWLEKFGLHWADEQQIFTIL
jgi:hypothetical protein